MTKNISKLLIAFFVIGLSANGVTKPHQPDCMPGISLWLMPAHIGYPAYTKPGVEAQFNAPLENCGPFLLTLTSIEAIEDSAQPSAPSGWLGFSSAPASLPFGGSDTLVVRLNVNGVVASGPTRLWGKIRFHYSPPTGTVDLPIDFIVADTIVVPQWDTITTQCGLPLTIGTNGNLGDNFVGGANLGFPQPSPECDTGSNNRGDARIYLGDASPVVVRRVGPNNYAASWSIYDQGFGSPNAFKPLYPSSNRGYFNAARWEGFNSGTFCTADSLIKVERTIWAPTGPTNVDSCRFMIIRTRYWPYMNGQSVNGLAISDAFDWDIPSDSDWVMDVCGTDPTRRLVYMRGFESQDSEVDCYNNSLRYGGAAMITMHMKDCIGGNAPGGTLYAGYNAANDSFVYPAGGFVPEQMWANMQATGYSNEARITDLHSVLVYKNGAANAGYTLPANDTLTVWTAIAVVRPTGGTVTQALDSLKKEIDKAFKWYGNMRNCIIGWCSCCIGHTGNVNKGPAEIPDLSDLSLLITYLTVTPRPILPCICEADINSSEVIDLTDLSLLIAYLTTEPRPTLPWCDAGPGESSL